MVFDLPSWLVTMIADFGVGKQMVEVLGGSIPVLCSGGGGAGYSDTVTPISVEGFTVCVFIATDGIVQDLIQMGTRRRSRKGFLLTGVVYKPTIPCYTMGGLTPPPRSGVLKDKTTVNGTTEDWGQGSQGTTQNI